MPKIELREHENFEAALRRFKRLVERGGTLKELREREAYEKPTSYRKRKKAAAIKRRLKAQAEQKLPQKQY